LEWVPHESNVSSGAASHRQRSHFEGRERGGRDIRERGRERRGED